MTFNNLSLHSVCSVAVGIVEQKNINKRHYETLDITITHEDGSELELSIFSSDGKTIRII